MKLFHFVLLCIVYFQPLSLFAQYHDNIWLFGTSNQAPPLSDSRMDFNFEPPLITLDPKPMSFLATCSVVSDAEGCLQFYTNGKWVA